MTSCMGVTGSSRLPPRSSAFTSSTRAPTSGSAVTLSKTRPRNLATWPRTVAGKAAMIMAYFMHLKFEKFALVLLLIPATIFCICMMFVFFFPEAFRLLQMRPH